MADGGIKLIDGSEFLEVVPKAGDIAQRLMQELDPQGLQLFTLPQFRAAAEAEISSLLHGVQLPAQRLDQAIQILKFPPEDSYQIDRPTFASKFGDLLQIVAAALEEDPLVVSILDGTLIKTLLEDEDDFAMLAENLFTELDVDDSGKLSRNELRAALLQMGIGMGVPIPSVKPEADSLLSSILEKYEVEGNEELGQAQFAKLLQGVLQELADSLGSEPIIIVLDVKVNNGHQLKKVLADKEQLSNIAHDIFEELDVNKDGTLDRAELRSFFESRGDQWGLPSKEENDIVQQLYDEVFSLADVDQSGKLDKEEFQLLVKGVFESFAQNLEQSPIFLSVDTA